MFKPKLLLLLSVILLLPAPTRAATFSEFEQTAVAEIVAYNSGEEDGQFGTGFFISYSGECLLTAAHVILNDDNTVMDDLYIILNVGEDDEAIYFAEALIAYSDADVAIVCANDETYPETFHHFFPEDQESFDAMETGDDLTALGYPSFGSETVTAVFGQLTGFLPWEVENGILKTDLDISGGISGAPLLTEDKTIAGMMLAKGTSDSGGVVSYASSFDFLNMVFAALADSLTEAGKQVGIAPEDCEAQTRGGNIVYVSDGTDHYDPLCSEPVDALKEDLVAAQFEHWCGASPKGAYVHSAVSVLNDDESSLDADDWRAYLDNFCGELENDDTYNYFTPEQDLGAILVKGETSSAVYAVLADGKRHPFPNTGTYATWYGEDFSGVSTLSSEQLAGYSMGKVVTYHPGTLVKIPSVPKVYVITDDQALRWITDEATAESLFGDNWNTKVYDIPESLFPNYTLADDIAL